MDYKDNYIYIWNNYIYIYGLYMDPYIYIYRDPFCITSMFFFFRSRDVAAVAVFVFLPSSLRCLRACRPVSAWDTSLTFVEVPTMGWRDG